MPRPAVADAFTAVAEPQRRRILGLLAGGERPVGAIVDRLGLSQPLVSKHLRILRRVDLVAVRGAGQQRLYRLHGPGLRPLRDWVMGFERFWNESFDKLDDFLQAQPPADNPGPQDPS